MEAEEVLRLGVLKGTRWTRWCQVKKVLGRIDKDGDGKMNFKEQKKKGQIGIEGAWLVFFPSV